MKRINMMVSEETKKDWDKFLETSGITTISKLIREGVDYYIKTRGNEREVKSFSNYTHDLKGELSSIKGFSQMLIEDYKDELSFNVLKQINEIYDKSLNIEKILNKILGTERIEKENYDILIVDDDNSTLFLLSEFFKNKGLTTRNTSSAGETLDLLQVSIPKLILLDILLNGDDGYEICKKIKSDLETNNEHKFVMYLEDRYYLLKLKDEKIMDKFAKDYSKKWRTLDVSILHKIILEQIMGINQDNLEDHVRYTRKD